MSMFINLLKKLNFIDEDITETDEVPVLKHDNSLPDDVNFITPRLLVIPFPSENRIDQLATYFNVNYKNKYMVWNLSEYQYDPERFDNQVIDCAYVGYPCPPLEQIFLLCNSIKAWLDSDEENLAIVHCQ